MIFDANAEAKEDSGIFGLPFTTEEAKLILIPVPWEVTTSYGGGTSQGPEAIFHASKQVDLFDFELGNFFAAGIAMQPISDEIKNWNEQAKQLAQAVIDKTAYDMSDALNQVNDYSNKLNDRIYHQTKKLLAEHKLVGLVGGDHSTPFGAIKAFSERYPEMGVLHVDAHADCRHAFEGFHHSHASIMRNVMTETSIKKLIQVGIRDFCEEEFNFIQQNKNKIHTFFDAQLYEQKAKGSTWDNICNDIIQCLPQEVYISFDIDGLDPRFCPHTGTPVPGGLDYQEAVYLIKKVVRSGRKLIGFDLNEVSLGVFPAKKQDAASEWDANVGARLLYQLCGYTIISAK